MFKFRHNVDFQGTVLHKFYNTLFHVLHYIVHWSFSRHEQKENIHTAYQNHYLKYSHPKLPSPVDHWAPVTPSSLPPPLPPHYSVTVSIQQPEALVLLCQVQEPLEVC